jgi:glycosyltransferase involved in cell wall biosynthesis
VDVTRALMISYCFPPLKYPRSVQISRVLRYLELPFTMITAEPGSDPLSDVDSTIPWPGPIHPDSTVRLLRPSAFDRRTIRVLLKCRLLSLVQPDRYRFWAMGAADTVAHAGLAAQHDVLVSFGQPMSDHLAALKVKRRTGIPWVAHFSDPWKRNPFRTSYLPSRLLDPSYERKVFEAADHLIFTSEESRMLVLEGYPQGYLSKSSVLPHSFDPGLYGTAAPRGDGKIRLVHVGNFYGHRTPDAFLEAIAWLSANRAGILQNLELHFYGHIPGAVRQRALAYPIAPATLQIHGSIPYVESLMKMKEADGLILLDADADQSVFLPSKLVDYLGAGRPIFGVTPPGTSATLLRSLGDRQVSPRDPETIAREFEAFLAADAPRTRDPGILAQFDARKIADEFGRIMERVSQSRRRDG